MKSLNKPATTNQIKAVAKQILPEVIRIRRHLHSYPELSFQEFETFNYLSSFLEKHHLDFRQAGDTGIIGEIKGINPEKRHILLRADIDALPITENTGLSFASKKPGLMHACGHDVHSAVLLGVLIILQQLRHQWEGCVRFVFQPGEEKLPGGAVKMIEEGVLENPKPDFVLAQHIYPELAAGDFGFCPGPYMASADELYFEILGIGGHAAQPEKTQNPIWISAKLIEQLHQLHLNIKDDNCLLSLGKIVAPGATNIIPDKVWLQGTLRTYDENRRVRIHSEIKTITKILEKEFKMNIKAEIKKGFPPLNNHSGLTQAAHNIAVNLFGANHVKNLKPRLTAEDFAWYGQQIPACFYRLGTGFKEKKSSPGLHHSGLIVNEDSLYHGLCLLSSLSMYL